MADLLSTLESPEQLLEYDIDKLSVLAGELRRKIIDTVSQNGGHLASNLGMVELTLALLAEFDFRRDKIVFDVGHQCYSWKLLTGRKEKFNLLRQKGGLSGFPKTNESSYDFFNTGHSSTSISAALGLTRAMAHTGKSGHVIAVIGDGALTGGMAFEALNDAGQSQENLIVVLNDNQMSIGKNVGGLSSHLESLRISRRYIKLKLSVESILRKIPLVGKPLCSLIQRIKSMDRLWLRDSGVFFEHLGFKYYGPIDGHNLNDLKHHLSAIHEIKGPVLLHVLTQKGKGYSYAEQAPDKFHGTAPFEIESGVCKPGEVVCNQTFSNAFGKIILDLAKKDTRICAVSAAMTSGTGLTAFAEQFPARLFDVGIAEQHALTLAAGMAAGGMKPIAALYSTFLQRAYDQLLHDICLQNLHVVIAVDRAGLVGEDGETHQGIYDLGFLMPLPNLEVYCPIDEFSLKRVMQIAVECDHPVAIRYPRSSMPDNFDYSNTNLDKNISSLKIKEGNDCTVVVLGVLSEYTLEAAQRLEQQEKISCDVFAVIRAKPFDFEVVSASAARTGRLIIIEDGVVRGGFGSSILPSILKAAPNIKFELLGVEEKPLDQAGRFELLHDQQLDSQGIFQKIFMFCDQNHKNNLF